MNPLRRAITVLLLASLGALSALVLGACGSDDVFGGDADEQVKVSVTERDLDPGRVVVNAGKIEFEVRNEGKRVHAFAVNTKDGVERTETIKPGESGSLTVDLSAGSYRMYDPRGGYRRRGVSGTVVVRSEDRDRDETVTERTVERTVVEEPDIDEPETQEPEVQDAPPPPPVQPPPPAQTVTKEVPAPPPPVEEPPAPE